MRAVAMLCSKQVRPGVTHVRRVAMTMDRSVEPGRPLHLSVNRGCAGKKGEEKLRSRCAATREGLSHNQLVFLFSL